WATMGPVCVSSEVEMAAPVGYAQASDAQSLTQGCLGLEGDAFRTADSKDEQASSVTRAGGGDRQRPEKPDRRCFKPRPLLRAGFAGFASGCRSDFLESFWLLSPGGWRAS